MAGTGSSDGQARWTEPLLQNRTHAHSGHWLRDQPMSCGEDDAVAHKLMQPQFYQDTNCLSWDVSWQAVLRPSSFLWFYTVGTRDKFSAYILQITKSNHLSPVKLLIIFGNGKINILLWLIGRIGKSYFQFLTWPTCEQFHERRDHSAWPQKSIWRRELLIP